MILRFIAKELVSYIEIKNKVLYRPLKAFLSEMVYIYPMDKV
jgi:hypothetical protein